MSAEQMRFRVGTAKGYNANTIYREGGDPEDGSDIGVANVYGIFSHTSVAEARADPRCAEGLAIADLFAASPDLLAVALEWTADPTECGCDTNGCQDTCLPARTRAAIARATGKD